MQLEGAKNFNQNLLYTISRRVLGEWIIQKVSTYLLDLTVNSTYIHLNDIKKMTYTIIYTDHDASLSNAKLPRQRDR